MKALVCEMCGSHDVVKQEGYYVCQSCGTKYTVEEARKMMIEGTVEVQGTVVVDQQKNLENYLKLAETAVEGNDIETAVKYADKVFEIEPTNYRAWIVRAKTIGWNSSLRDNKLPAALLAAKRALEYAPDNIKDSLRDELVLALSHNILALYNASSDIFTVSRDLSMQHSSKITTLWLQIVKELNPSKEICEQVISLCKQEHNRNTTMGAGHLACTAIIYNSSEPYYVSFRKALLPETVTQEDLKAKSGCYVATAVYGSYDCPEVWTLRRFRDDTLATTWYGRAFIRAYYTISPTLVKWFGEANWFKSLWKPTLDRMVNSLNERGVQDTPYHDRQW